MGAGGVGGAGEACPYDLDAPVFRFHKRRNSGPLDRDMFSLVHSSRPGPDSPDLIREDRGVLRVGDWGGPEERPVALDEVA